MKKTIFTAIMLFSIVVFAQAPSIKYSSVQSSYTVGVPMTITSITSGAVSKTAVTTLAGNINPNPYKTGATATFIYPIGIASTADGTVYEVDTFRPVVSKISPTGYTAEFVGNADTTTTNGIVTYTGRGYADGTGNQVRINSPFGLATDALGNVYVADTYNQRIRKITPNGIATTIAGNGVIGFLDGTGTAAQFNYPSALCVDSNGNIYVTDSGSSRIRKITTSGAVTTVAGLFGGNADGNGMSARFKKPMGIAVDTSGNLYVSDTGNGSIRKIDTSGNVTTYVSASSFNGTPKGITYNNGSLYVSDNLNSVIKLVTGPNSVVNYAGVSGSSYFKNGDGNKAWFYAPEGIASDAVGNLYVADYNVNQIRKVSVTTKAFTITPALPKGLSLDSNSGVISGSPAQASPLTNYTVTASNYSGSTTAIVSFQVTL